MRVIGAAGQMRCGKNILADHLCEKLNKKEGFACWKRVGFADEVKRVFCDNFNVDLDFIEEWKVKKEIPEGFTGPVREGLQLIGDSFRKIKDKIWIDKVFAKRIPMVISDVRYPNEFKRVKREGGINVLIGRPDFMNDDPNGSEALIKPYVEWCLQNLEESVTFLNDIIGGPEGLSDFHIFIKNDSSIEEYYRRIDEFIIPYVEKFNFEESTACLIQNK